jgi:hypothetical protein
LTKKILILNWTKSSVIWFYVLKIRIIPIFVLSCSVVRIIAPPLKVLARM